MTTVARESRHSANNQGQPAKSASNLEITFTLFREQRTVANASKALTEILRAIVKRDLGKLEELSEAVRTKKRMNIARTPQEIYPKRPGKARAVEIAPGWLVGLNIANREKAMIVRGACKVYGLAMPGDVDVEFPNA